MIQDAEGFVQKAKEFALRAHGAQLYGANPYSVHLAHVVRVLSSVLGHQKPEVHPELWAAAWLHDVLEDTPTTRDELEQEFGARVAEAVWRVSDEPGESRAERKRLTYAKIAGHRDATLVKLCDRMANLEASMTWSNAGQRIDKLALYINEHEGFGRALRSAETGDELLLRAWRAMDELIARARLQLRLGEELPIARATGFSVQQTDIGAAELLIPLHPNRNHMSTAFGGSLQMTQVIACYAWLMGWLDRQALKTEIVLFRSEVDYLAPVASDFVVRCSAPSEDELARFRKTITRKGKARLRLLSFAASARDGVALSRMTAEFVALSRD